MIFLLTLRFENASTSPGLHSDFSPEKELTLASMTERSNYNDDNNIKQHVVLFVGPHKSGSSSVNGNLRKWLNSDSQHELKSLSENWAWPIPPLIKSKMKGTKMERNPYMFFQSALRGRKECLKSSMSCEEQKEILQNAKSLFRNEFVREWNSGKSLLLAHEGFDFVGYDYGNSKRIEISTILDEMPWNLLNDTTVYNDKDDVTVVVNWRSPRAGHFISTYHQCSCMKTETFSEYAANPKHWIGYTNIDSLLLAQRFLDAGLKVVLIDLEGAKQSQHDLPNVIACDVMGAPCTSDKKILGQSEDSEVKNVKTGLGSMGSTTPEQIERLENVIRRRDCSFQHLRNHPRLEVLYDSELRKVWEECKLRKDPGISRDVMKAKIHEIFTTGTP